MIALALDLTGAVGDVAIVDSGGVVVHHQIESPDGFGHLIFPRLTALLGEAGLALSQIDCYASATGPGSFTGVRIGLSVTKGLAEAAGKPAIGVSNLRALAAAGEGLIRVPVFDARRGDVFTAVFDEGGCLLEEECVTPLERFLPRLARWKDCVFATQDEQWLRSQLDEGYESVKICEVNSGLATTIARCALHDLAAGTAGDPAGLDANYVRSSDAELAWHDR